MRYLSKRELIIINRIRNNFYYNSNIKKINFIEVINKKFFFTIFNKKMYNIFYFMFLINFF